MAANNDEGQVDAMRVRYGFWVVIAGFGLVAVVALLAIYRWTTASDVATIISSITGVVGTVVGAFFGVQVGSAGKERAEKERRTAERRALRLAAATDPAVAARIIAETDSAHG